MTAGGRFVTLVVFCEAEELALKIDSGKGPVAVYVIERAEKTATEQQ